MARFECQRKSKLKPATTYIILHSNSHTVNGTNGQKEAAQNQTQSLFHHVAKTLLLFHQKHTEIAPNKLNVQRKLNRIARLLLRSCLCFLKISYSCFRYMFNGRRKNAIYVVRHYTRLAKYKTAAVVGFSRTNQVFAFRVHGPMSDTKIYFCTHHRILYSIQIGLISKL